VNTLTVHNAGIDLGKRRVIADVSFQARGGEMVGVIGANGVGKSTLLRAMAGLIPCRHGSVMLGDTSIAIMSPTARARAVAYLPQGQSFHWSISVAHAVGLGRLPHLGPLSRLSPQDETAISSAMERAEVRDLAGRYVTELSGGERSRVLLARALAVDAPVLLADEPTAALDLYHQLHTMEILRALTGDGKLVVAVFHDLSLAARFCDRLLLLHEGTLIADGPPQQILNSDLLERAYGIEVLQSAIEGQTVVLPWKRKPTNGATTS